MKIDNVIIEASLTEFKVDLETEKPAHWLKTLVAFANSNGGSMYFGVNDNAELIGLKNAQDVVEKITDFIDKRITPSLPYELIPYSKDKLDYIEIKVSKGNATPYYYFHEKTREVYVRKGSSTVLATNQEIVNLVLRGANLTYDRVVTNIKQTEKSFTVFEATWYDRTHTKFTKEDYISLGLSNDEGFLTNAGVLIADQNTYLHNRLFCTRWNGLTKTGLDEAKDDREIEGSIVNQLIRALDFFEANTHKRWHKESTGRVEEPDYDVLAIQEALVNAIIHRDYTELGSEVCLDIYDDRIEISSPGIAYDNQNIPKNVDFIVKSKRRNPILADVFSRMHYMDRRGSGLKKITDETGRLFKDESYHVEYYNNNGFFMVTIYNANYGKVIDESQINHRSTEESQKGKIELSTLAMSILNEIKANNSIKTTEIANRLNIARETVSRNIAKLKKCGYIARVGSDKFGHWEVKE